MSEAIHRPVAIVLMAGALLAAGLMGAAMFVTVVPRTAGTSPLAALFLLLWSCTYVTAATLVWRRSHLAAFSLVAAVSLLLFPAAFIVPGGQLLLPACAVLVVIAYAGYRYLRRVRA
jgi:hypothetical protein